PDTHTMFLQDGEGHEIFGVRYLGPTQVQITGSFHAAGLPEPVLVSTERGVHWKGGGVPPGTRIDLTPQGKGRIDFERSGLIRVLPGAVTASPRTRRTPGAAAATRQPARGA